MPVITLKTVVLPAPFGPITLTTSRSATCRSSSEIARNPPNDSVRCSRLRKGPSRRSPAAAPAGAAAGDRRDGPVLNLEHLTLSFGGLRAISELDLQVADREVVSVIGPNGAGKTTVFNVITGIY